MSRKKMTRDQYRVLALMRDEKREAVVRYVGPMVVDAWLGQTYAEAVNEVERTEIPYSWIAKFDSLGWWEGKQRDFQFQVGRVGQRPETRCAKCLSADGLAALAAYELSRKKPAPGANPAPLFEEG